MVTYDKAAARQIDRSYQTPEIINQRLQTLHALALKPGESVLDVGCGTGLLGELMANRVGTEGSVTGIDLSNDMLDFARSRCHELSQVRFFQGSAESLDIESSTIDVVTCTQTLLYVDKVAKSLKELFRVLKPGGRVAIIETDWRGAILNSPDYALTRKIFDAWDQSVASPNLPGRLPKMLSDLTFGVIDVQAIPIINCGYNKNSFSAGTLRMFSQYAVRAGVCSDQQADNWRQEIVQLAESDDYFFSVNRYLVTAVKIAS